MTLGLFKSSVNWSAGLRNYNSYHSIGTTRLMDRCRLGLHLHTLPWVCRLWLTVKCRRERLTPGWWIRTQRLQFLTEHSITVLGSSKNLTVIRILAIITRNFLSGHVWLTLPRKWRRCACRQNRKWRHVSEKDRRRRSRSRASSIRSAAQWATFRGNPNIRSRGTLRQRSYTRSLCRKDSGHESYIPRWRHSSRDRTDK